MYETERIEHEGFTIRIINDEGSEEPDWGGDEFFLSCRTRNYCFGQDGFTTPEEHLLWGEGPWGACGEDVPAPPPPGEESEAWELYLQWQEEHDPTYEVWPFTCGDVHGAGTFCFWLMDLDDLERRDPDGWVYVKKVTSPLEQLAHPERDPEKIRDQLIEKYTQWANNDIWGFIVEDSDGEELDACWGFYGTEEAIEGGESAAAHMAKQSRPVMVLLIKESDSHSQCHTPFLSFTKTYQVPLAVSGSQVPAWVMATQVAPDSAITGAALMSSFSPVPATGPSDSGEPAARASGLGDEGR